MPLLSSTITAQLVSLTLFGGIMPMVVAASTPAPSGNDVYAVLGSCLATFIVAIKCIEDRRNYLFTISVVLSTIFVGSLFPGFLAWVLTGFFISQEKIDIINWQSWAFLGFFFGLGGVAVVNMILKKWPVFLESKYQKYVQDNKKEFDKIGE